MYPLQSWNSAAINNDNNELILLFTTCDAQGGRLFELERLLESIKNTLHNTKLNIKHYLLLQRLPANELAPIIDKYPFVQGYAVEEMVSLSNARNLLMEEAFSTGDIDHAKWIAFPDDDAWYPSGFISIANSLLNKQNCILVCRYSSSPLTIDKDGAFTGNGKQKPLLYTKIASSNTMFFSANIIQKIGYFDERLGVGAPINGGEDLDYAMRALKHSEIALVDVRPLIGHRDKITSIRSKYYAGGLFALVRATAESPVLFSILTRKILVGAYLLLNREIGFSDLIKAYRCGFSALTNPKALAFNRENK